MHNIRLAKGKRSELRTLLMSFPDYNNGELTLYDSFIFIDLFKNSTFDDCVDYKFTSRFKIKDFELNREAINFAIKCYLYIHSGEPDLRFQKALNLPTTQKEKKIRMFIRNNQDKLSDMTLIGFNYKKSILYSKESINVSGHMKWQRYGPGNSLYKLIWIEDIPKIHLKICYNRKRDKVSLS